MTYLQFHLVFIVPPLLLLGWGLRRTFPALGRRAPLALPLILVVAFIYTTPWDNYLVWKEVWGYPPERVLARIGYVPVEEYLFFLLQPGLGGMLFYRLLARMPPQAPLASPGLVRMVGALPWILATGVGVWLLGSEPGTYMGLILAWAAPVVAFQWLFMGPTIWRLRKAVFPAILLPTLYLWVADWYAISQGIWYISERFTFGVNPFGLPVEEATFFLITNVLVVFGAVLFLAPGLPHLSAPETERVPRVVSRGALAGGVAMALGLLACDGAPQDARGSGSGEQPVSGGRSLPAQARDRLIVPGERVGMLTSQTSEEDLRVMVDPEFIQRGEIPVGEGFCYPGTVLFPDSPDRVEVTWQDSGRLSPAVVRIEGVGASWRTPAGTGLGSTLQEMQEANGGPFLFLGFGWDYGGRVADWMGGSMEPPWVGGSPGLVVILDSDSLGVLMDRDDPLVRDLAGDHAIRSDRPELQRMGIRVVGLEVTLGPEPATPGVCVGPDGIGTGVGSAVPRL